MDRTVLLIGRCGLPAADASCREYPAEPIPAPLAPMPLGGPSIAASRARWRPATGRILSVVDYLRCGWLVSVAGWPDRAKGRGPVSRLVLAVAPRVGVSAGDVVRGWGRDPAARDRASDVPRPVSERACVVGATVVGPACTRPRTGIGEHQQAPALLRQFRAARPLTRDGLAGGRGRPSPRRTRGWIPLPAARLQDPRDEDRVPVSTVPRRGRQRRHAGGGVLSILPGEHHRRAVLWASWGS